MMMVVVDEIRGSDVSLIVSYSTIDLAFSWHTLFSLKRLWQPSDSSASVVTVLKENLGCRWKRQPPDMEGTANILNKQSWTADKGWSSSLVVGQGANSHLAQAMDQWLALVNMVMNFHVS